MPMRSHGRSVAKKDRRHKHGERNGAEEARMVRRGRTGAQCSGKWERKWRRCCAALGKDCDYERELRRLQIELVKLQEWIKHEGLRVVVLFEGRDAAGKGGAIKRIAESLNPRVCRIVALATPTEREKTQWYFQRYVAHLPAAGEMVLFDRSWYNRAGVEHVMGFCTEREYLEFMQSCPEFERMLVRSGIILIKYWFSVSDEEQERRFQDRMDKPTKRWKLSPMDLESRKHWADYSRAKDEMFAVTDTKQVPWFVVNAERQEVSAAECDPASAVDDSLSRSDAGAAEAAADCEVEVCAAADARAEFCAGGVSVEQ